MACFIIPMTQAIVTTAFRKKFGKNSSKNPWISQLPKLELMLWGGTVVLIIDHILSGELTWRFPFFTAMMQDNGIVTMLHEMLTVGVPMSLCVTLIYCVMVARAKSLCNTVAR